MWGGVAAWAARSLFLQQLLYYNCWFAPCWGVAVFCSYLVKFEKGTLKDKLNDNATTEDELAVILGSVWLLMEPIRLRLGYTGNLKEKVHQVKPRVYGRYKDQGFPIDFPVTSKCIVLFEEIEGVDVILFGMYLYEYGHKTPQPNHRRVYVSYLDSVHYFRPRNYRTLVYHEMLIAYLAYAKVRRICERAPCP